MSDIIPGDKVEAYQQLMTRQFDVHDARDILAMDDAALEMFVTEGEKPLCDDGFALSALQNSARAVLLFDAGEKYGQGLGLLAVHAHEQGLKSPLTGDEFNGIRNTLNDFIKKIGVLAGDRVLEKPCAADAALGVVQAVCASPYFVRDAIADRNPSRFENGGGDCTVSGTTLDEAKNR